jgi:hypothetical protein
VERSSDLRAFDLPSPPRKSSQITPLDAGQADIGGGAEIAAAIPRLPARAFGKSSSA